MRVSSSSPARREGAPRQQLSSARHDAVQRLREEPRCAALHTAEKTLYAALRSGEMGLCATFLAAEETHGGR